MNTNALCIGQAYDCFVDGSLGKVKECIVPLAKDTQKRRQYVVVGALKLAAKAPGFFKRLLTMSYQEIVDEDLDGGPDREWSCYVWRMEITEAGVLYYEDFDAYFVDLVEVKLPALE